METSFGAPVYEISFSPHHGTNGRVRKLVASRIAKHLGKVYRDFGYRGWFKYLETIRIQDIHNMPVASLSGSEVGSRMIDLATIALIRSGVQIIDGRFACRGKSPVITDVDTLAAMSEWV